MENPRLTVSIMIKELSRDLKLRVVAGSAGLENVIAEKELHRPGLLLVGFMDLFPKGRIQLIGNTESLFLSKLSQNDSNSALTRLISQTPPCIIVTNKNKVSKTIQERGNEYSVPILTSSLSTNDLSYVLFNYLSYKFAPQMMVHGTLVDVYGTGLLFTGRAGIGKSEIALDLVERGHRMVADDVVVLTLKPPGILIGTSPEMLEHFLEIRGVGIINVREIFGVRAIRLQKRIETVVELVEWDGSEDYERLGLDEEHVEFLGLSIPIIKLPVYPGKNVTVIAETIALNHHLKIYGYHSARELSKILINRMNNKRKIEKYLKWDNE